MNVFRFENKALCKSLISWTIAILVVFFLLIVGVYPIFSDGIVLLQEMMEAMPAEFLQAFGFNIQQMLSYDGFYGFVFVYLSLMAAIMAASMALQAFSREKRNHCQEFLFVKPIGRKKLFLAKLAAVLWNLTVFNVLYMAAALYCFSQYSAVTASSVLAALSMFFMQLVFVAFGIAIAVFCKKIRSSAEVAALLGFGCFLVSALVNVLEEDFLRFFSPLHFFSPEEIFAQASLEASTTIWAIILTLGCVIGAYRRFVQVDAASL